MLPRSVFGVLGPDDVATMTTAVTANAAMAVQNHHFSKMGRSASAGAAGGGAAFRTTGGGAVTVVGGPSAAGTPVPIPDGGISDAGGEPWIGVSGGNGANGSMTGGGGETGGGDAVEVSAAA